MRKIALNIIMPGEPAIREAAQEIEKAHPGFFDKVKEIRISYSGSDFGHVKTDEEGIIYINFPKIKSSMQLGEMDQETIQNAIKNGVEQVLSHEGGHIKDIQKSKQDGKTDPKQFSTEYSAEQTSKDIMSKIKNISSMCDFFAKYASK